jgi:adenylate kinase family enzyme
VPIAVRARSCLRTGSPFSEFVKRRLEVFHTDTCPLLEFYRQRGILLVIDGTRSADDVSNSIREALAPFRSGSRFRL